MIHAHASAVGWLNGAKSKQSYEREDPLGHTRKGHVQRRLVSAASRNTKPLLVSQHIHDLRNVQEERYFLDTRDTIMLLCHRFTAMLAKVVSRIINKKLKEVRT